MSNGEVKIGGDGVSKIEVKKNEIQLQGRMKFVKFRCIYIYISRCLI